MASSLEDLLQEALADFEEATPATRSVPGPASAPQAEPALAAHEPAQHAPPAPGGTGVSDSPPKAAPKGLGLGLGLGGVGPLGRRQRKDKDTTNAAAGAVPASSDIALGSESDSSGSKPAPKLGPEAQRLADEVMGLLQDAGFGEGSNAQRPDAMASALAGLMVGSSGADAGAAGVGAARPSGSTAADDDPFAQLFSRMLGGLMPPGAASAAGSADDGEGPPPEFAALMQQMMMGSGAHGLGLSPGSGPGVPSDGAMHMLAASLGGAGAGGGSATAATAAGPSSSRAPAAGNDDALASSRLAGLAQQTLKTVSQQAKKTRGHVEGGAGGPGRPGGGAGGAGAGAAAGAFGLSSLLRELGGGLGSGDAGGEGEGGSGVNMMVDYIMHHLLSKDVLYGPLKEIRDRYPPWLEAHQGTLPPDEYQRYVAQYESVQRVCAHYETAPGDFAKLMDLIQEMQTYGDPPGDIVEEMTGGAGRDINSILSPADEEPGPAGPQPALDELSSELDKCKVQ